MPELPEVEAARRLVEAQCAGKRIKTVEAAADDSAWLAHACNAHVVAHNRQAAQKPVSQAPPSAITEVFDGCSPEDLTAALQGKVLLGVQRKGKYLWLVLDQPGPVPLMHFGGSLQLRNRMCESSVLPCVHTKLVCNMAQGLFSPGDAPDGNSRSPASDADKDQSEPANAEKPCRWQQSSSMHEVKGWRHHCCKPPYHSLHAVQALPPHAHGVTNTVQVNSL